MTRQVLDPDKFPKGEGNIIKGWSLVPLPTGLRAAAATMSSGPSLEKL